MHPTTVAFVAVVCTYVVASGVLGWRGWLDRDWLKATRREAQTIVGIELVTLVPWTCAIALTNHPDTSGFALAAQSVLLLWLVAAYKKWPISIVVLTILASTLIIIATFYAILQDHFNTVGGTIALVVPHCLHRIFVDGWWLCCKFIEFKE